jgi:hypothetical protein
MRKAVIIVLTEPPSKTKTKLFLKVRAALVAG